MSMTEAQASKLGALIAAARAKAGLSLADLATQVNTHRSWIGYLEQGHYLDPAPERLAMIAQVLGVPIQRIDRITKGAVQAGLPQPSVYFRAKCGLSAEDAARVERYVEGLRRKPL